MRCSLLHGSWDQILRRRPFELNFIICVRVLRTSPDDKFNSLVMKNYLRTNYPTLYEEDKKEEASMRCSLLHGSWDQILRRRPFELNFIICVRVLRTSPDDKFNSLVMKNYLRTNYPTLYEEDKKEEASMRCSLLHGSWDQILRRRPFELNFIICVRVLRTSPDDKFNSLVMKNYLRTNYPTLYEEDKKEEASMRCSLLHGSWDQILRRRPFELNFIICVRVLRTSPDDKFNSLVMKNYLRTNYPTLYEEDKKEEASMRCSLLHGSWDQILRRRPLELNFIICVRVLRTSPDDKFNSLVMKNYLRTNYPTLYEEDKKEEASMRCSLLHGSWDQILRRRPFELNFIICVRVLRTSPDDKFNSLVMKN